jgi:hypothetical protein
MTVRAIILAVILPFFSASVQARECRWADDSPAFVIAGAHSSTGAMAVVEHRDGRTVVHYFRGLVKTRPVSLCEFESSTILDLKFSPKSTWLLLELETSQGERRSVAIEMDPKSRCTPIELKTAVRDAVFLSDDEILAVPIQDEDTYSPRGFVKYNLKTRESGTALEDFVAEAVLDSNDGKYLLRVMKPEGDLLRPCLIVWDASGEVRQEICR